MKLTEIKQRTIEILDAIAEDYPEVEEYREAWKGTLADFGQREAGNLVFQAEDYKEYQEKVEAAARKLLGDQFVVYRYMTEDQAESIGAGAEIGAMAVTLNKSFADSFHKFAAFKKDGQIRKVYSFKAAPESIIMVGKVEEDELVLDGASAGWDLKEV